MGDGIKLKKFYFQQFWLLFVPLKKKKNHMFNMQRVVSLFESIVGFTVRDNARLGVHYRKFMDNTET